MYLWRWWGTPKLHLCSVFRNYLFMRCAKTTLLKWAWWWRNFSVVSCVCHGLNFWSCWYLGKVRCTSTITALAHVQRVYRLFARTRHGLFSTSINVENEVFSCYLYLLILRSRNWLVSLVYLYTVPSICMP